MCEILLKYSCFAQLDNAVPPILAVAARKTTGHDARYRPTFADTRKQPAQTSSARGESRGANAMHSRMTTRSAANSGCGASTIG